MHVASSRSYFEAESGQAIALSTVPEAGIVGVLLALPVAAGVRVLVEQLRIELPGEQPGETTQRTLDEAAETIYAQQTEGVSAIDAAAVATVMAEQAQEDALAATERVEQPIEVQGDNAPLSSHIPIT